MGRCETETRPTPQNRAALADLNAKWFGGCPDRKRLTYIFYATRLPAYAVLREKIAHRLTRPVGRPSLTKVKRFCEGFQYQAAP